MYGRVAESSNGGSTVTPHRGGRNHDKGGGRSEEVKRDVLECLQDLMGQLRVGNGFAHRLILSMNEAIASSSSSSSSSSASNSHGLHLKDIVAYGIGNFSTERFRSPMLQLACLLLLRRCAARDSSMNYDRSDDRNDAENLCMEESFQDDQNRVPIHYYDPCILPVEKELLELAFHVHVLGDNDMGKRTMGMKSVQCHCQHSNAVDVSSSQSLSSTTMSPRFHFNCTLFYMPHCPMRLYSNVLWAHWSRIFPPVSVEMKGNTPSDAEFIGFPDESIRGDDDNDETKDGPVIIFGNSFREYEDRAMLSSRERIDDTNAIFIVAPFAKEIPIDVVGNAGKRRGVDVDAMANGALRHSEMAFNDCSLIYFSVATMRRDHASDNGDDRGTRRKGWPDRPKEWFVSATPDDGGELR